MEEYECRRRKLWAGDVNEQIEEWRRIFQNKLIKSQKVNWPIDTMVSLLLP